MNAGRHCLLGATSILSTVYSDAFFFYKLILFIYFWLRWVFLAELGLSLVVASGGYS